MTQVSKITSNKELSLPMVGGAVPALSSADKEVLTAFSSQKVAKMKTHEVGAILNSSISRAYYHAGHAIPDQKELLALQVYLAEFMKNEKMYENICIEEIAIAIKRGSDKQYGEYYGINPATITGWVKSHVESESRKSAKLMEQQIMLSQKVKTEPTPEEQKDAFIQRLEMLYIFHQTGKKIMPTEGTFYFEKLYNAKVIRLSEEKRWDLRTRAYEIIQPSKNPYNAKDGIEHKRLKADYEVFLTNGINGNEVKKYAMYLGLLQWFDDLKTFEREIRDEIL